jgi:subtilisin-like proprotein convertase family protein
MFDSLIRSKSRTAMPQVRGLAMKLALGMLAASLTVSAATPVLAGKPDHGPRASGSKQEQELAVAGKRHHGKSKTVKKSFSNTESINIPAEGAADDFGPADPYPSPIGVAGFKKAKITDVNVVLRNFSHTFPADVDVLLVAPGGRNATVMADVGDSLGDEDAVAGITLTLDDEAATQLSVDEQVTSGSFRPLDGNGPGPFGDLTEFPAPAATPSGDNALSTFDGINPNGEWQLFVLDDDQNDVGSLANGWTLTITAKAKSKKHRH